MLFLLLEIMLQSHSLLFLSFELLLLLVGFAFAAALLLVLQLEVLFVDSTLLGQDFQKILLNHLFLSLEVLNSRLRDADIDANEICLLSCLHEGAGVALEQLRILEFPSVLVQFPRSVDDFFVKFSKILLVGFSFLFHFLVNLVSLAGEMFSLFDCAL